MNGRDFLGCNKSRSLKKGAMLFTNPSKLEAVKTEFNSIYLKKMEQLNKIDVDFIKRIPLKKVKK
jgi:Asp-tRNA(Asn)/Glu-tRNA(Gln) amidotransferase C subunit